MIGERHGKGEYIHKLSGDIFKGMYENGQKHCENGETFIKSRNMKKVSVWIRGKEQLDDVSVVYGNGDQYRGGIDEESKRYGPGVFKYFQKDDNDDDESKTDAGKKGKKKKKKYGLTDLTAGKTNCFDTYDGMWEGDLRHGYGRMIFLNGDEYEGEYVDDKMHGEGR